MKNKKLVPKIGTSCARVTTLIPHKHAALINVPSYVFHLTADKPAKAYFNYVSALHLGEDVPL
jgi:hypothetical protein